MARTLVGRYELEVPLGRGGSGEVWRGRDLATRQPVAVKLIELGVIADPVVLTQTIDRFRREARVLDGLSHPNIVSARDAGRSDNQLFLVMELVNGISLASFRDERATNCMGLFPVSSVLHIARQVSAGLSAAHLAGVVHRDIKPGNLMVTSRLGITIIDFGIARLLNDNSPRLTLPSHVIGTFAYTSPEQAQDDDVDGRADLYSLGCVLYELLAGRQPFYAETPEELVWMHQTVQAVPLSVIRPGLPAGLPKLVGDLMKKDRAARPADAAQVIRRIAAISDAPGGGVPAEEIAEADRLTAKPDVPPPAAGEPWQRAPTPEAGRRTVRTWESLNELAGSEVTPTPAYVPHPRPPDQPLPVPPWQAPPPDPPAEPRGERASTPPWPGGPVARRRLGWRLRWRRALGALLSIAVVAGVGTYFWERAHEPLKITNIKVTPPNDFVRCDETAHITATIMTSGRGGVIKVNWIERIPGTKEQTVPQVYDVGSEGVTEVHLDWIIRGKGTGEATVELQVTEPDQGLTPEAAFPYHCP